jgi:hypothetical protein
MFSLGFYWNNPLEFGLRLAGFTWITNGSIMIFELPTDQNPGGVNSMFAIN